MNALSSLSFFWKRLGNHKVVRTHKHIFNHFNVCLTQLFTTLSLHPVRNILEHSYISAFILCLITCGLWQAGKAAAPTRCLPDQNKWATQPRPHLHQTGPTCSNTSAVTRLSGGRSSLPAGETDVHLNKPTIRNGTSVGRAAPVRVCGSSVELHAISQCFPSESVNQTHGYLTAC